MSLLPANKTLARAALARAEFLALLISPQPDALTLCTVDLTNDIDVIVTPLRDGPPMNEQQFDYNTSAQLSWCTTFTWNVLDELGLDGYIGLGLELAGQAAAAWEAAGGRPLSSDDRAMFDEVFADLALEIAAIDRPPLACMVLDGCYHRWFVDVFLRRRVGGGLAGIISAAHALLTAEISMLRAAGFCCEIGSLP